jgi:hypothetical protein
MLRGTTSLRDALAGCRLNGCALLTHPCPIPGASDRFYCPGTIGPEFFRLLRVFPVSADPRRSHHPSLAGAGIRYGIPVNAGIGFS